MVLKSAGAFPAPRLTLGLYGLTVDLRRAEDAPQAASGVYSRHHGGFPFKDMLALFSVSCFSYSGGLFLISLYVYGHLHASGQPGLGVCLFFSFLLFSFSPLVSSQIIMTKTVPRLFFSSSPCSSHFPVFSRHLLRRRWPKWLRPCSSSLPSRRKRFWRKKTLNRW